MRERRRRQRCAFGKGETTCRDRLLDLRVPRRIHHDSDRRVILRRRPDHRRTADVDLLNAFVLRRTRGDRLPERVQIDHHQVERLDAQFRDLLQVRRKPGVGQQPAVDRRMQGLHPAVEALRESGDLLDRGDRQPGVGDRAGRAAGGHQGNPGAVQQPGQLDQAGLVRHRQQGPPDRPPTGIRSARRSRSAAGSELVAGVSPSVVIRRSPFVQSPRRGHWSTPRRPRPAGFARRP